MDRARSALIPPGNVAMNHRIQKLSCHDGALAARRRFARPSPFVGAIGVLAGVIALSLPRDLKAQSTDRRVQLSLNANLLAYDSLKLSSGAATASATDTTWGPGASGLGVGLGYGVTDNWLLGVQLLGSSATFSESSAGASDLKLTSYSVLPRLDYTFGLEQVVRPYVGATLGLRGTSTSGAASSKTSSTEFVFGGSAGVRAFASPGFSIDPSVTLLGSTGSEQAGGESLDRSGFTFLVGVAFSGWIDTADSSSATSSMPARVLEAKIKAPAPSETLATEDDGTIRAEIVVAGRGRLRLIGRPVLDGREVLIELVGTGAESDQLTQCRDFRVLVDGSELSTGSVPRPVPGTNSALQLLVTPKLIEAVGRAEDSATIITCGVTWEISAESRVPLFRFFEQFRDSAKRYERWDESAPISRAEPSKPPGHAQAVAGTFARLPLSPGPGR